PKFFRASRTRMENDELPSNIGGLQQFFRVGAGIFRKRQMDRVLSARYSDWFKQRKMIIAGVHIAHPMLDEFVVKTCSKLRTHFDSERDDSLFRARKKHEQRRPIVSS